MKKIAWIFITFLASLPTFGQDVTGEWNGILKAQGMQLRLVFKITQTDQGYDATLDSPDQGASDIPVTSVTFDDSVLILSVAQIGVNYQGALNPQNRIAGTFSQSGQSFPLELTREIPEKEVPIRPQEPTQPYPYHSEEVHFETKSKGGNIKLAGTLTFPQKGEKFPVAILISGSGPQDRDEAFMGHKPFLVLADHLTRNGIAVLRYDDRGTAESTGNFHTATSWDFAQDVHAAIAYVKSREELNAKQIGLIGHSEGGLIAPMVAAKSRAVSFIVLLAGPGVRGDQILMKQVELMGKTNGLNEEEVQDEKAVVRGAFDIVLKSADTQRLKTELTAYFKQVLQEDPPDELPGGLSEEEFINLQVAQLSRPWTQYFLRYDPATSLKKVKCPTFAINGGKDVQVSPENLTAIDKALKEGGNKNVSIKEYPKLNHLFQECETGAMSEYAQIEQTFSPIVLKDISNWIMKQVKSERD